MPPPPPTLRWGTLINHKERRWLLLRRWWLQDRGVHLELLGYSNQPTAVIAWLQGVIRYNGPQPTMRDDCDQRAASAASLESMLANPAAIGTASDTAVINLAADASREP